MRDDSNWYFCKGRKEIDNFYRNVVSKVKPEIVAVAYAAGPGECFQVQAVTRTIYETQTLVDVEDRIATVNEIFRLQDADEYSAAERVYLSASRKAGSAIVLELGPFVPPHPLFLFTGGGS